WSRPMATRSAARCCSRSARRARAPPTAASTASLWSRWRSGRPSSRSMSACSSASAGRRFALWWHKGGHCRRAPECGSRGPWALAGAGVALAASGHAGTAQPSFVTRPSVFLHAIAVAFWIGSLLPLLVLVRTAPQGDVTLKRFSSTIPFALVAPAASGVLLAVVQLDRLDALWTTNYGLVLSGKLALILALLALAAANRYRLVPRFE